jgi:hypothetical protein
MINCRTCGHPREAEINLQLLNRVPYRTIIASFPEKPLTLGGLNRHLACVKEKLGDAIQSRASESAERSFTLLDRVESVIKDAQAILSDARSTKDLKNAVAALGAITRALELCGKLSGQLSTGSSGINLSINTRTTNNVVNIGTDDVELASLVMEATNNWNPDRIEHLKTLTLPQS